MDTEDLIDRFRSDVHDTATPYLWSDVEVFSYLDEAQKWYCRETGGIADSTSIATRIVMVAGDPWGVVHPSVLKLRHMQRESDDKEIDIWNFEDAQFRPAYDTTYNVPLRITLDSTEGLVSKAITGMEQYKVRWHYVPETADSALCIIYRLPLETISVDNIADLEIPDEDRIILLDGMKAQAYNKEDAETFDKNRQEKHEGAFLSKCAEAKHKREKREHKYRTIRYGGI